MTRTERFTPEGVEDMNYWDCEKKDALQAILKQALQKYGYQKISTPTFEYYDLFRDIDTAIDKDKMYKLIDADGKILVLRPDATIPIARMAALSSEPLQQYKKYMYFTNIFRSEDFRAGGKREFTQAGVEYLGNPSAEADAEVVAAAVDALLAVGFRQIRLDLGNARYFNGLLEEISLNTSAKVILRDLVENKNVAELEKFLTQVALADPFRKVLLELPFLYGDFAKTLAKAKDLALNQEMNAAVEELYRIYHLLEAYGVAAYVYADMGFVNDLDYYSGMIFKAYLGNIGSAAASGGRYDGLVEKFGRNLPATGFGLNVDAIYEAVLKEELLETVDTVADVGIYCNEATLPQAIQEAQKLRRQGKRVLLYANAQVDDKRVKEQIDLTK